jgi:lactoylglutathione lyase
MTETIETTETSSAASQSFAAFKPKVTHVAYHVADIDRALAFYCGVLGMKETMRIPLGQGLHEVILGFPDSRAAGVILMWHVEKKDARKLGDGYSRIVLNVNDVDAATALLAKHGAPVVTQPTRYGSMKFSMVKDPDGYVIELLQMVG